MNQRKSIIRRAFQEGLESRLQFCAEHILGQEPIELRPDLVGEAQVAGAASIFGVASGTDHLANPSLGLVLPTKTSTKTSARGSGTSDVADPADIVWINRGSAASDTDGFNARFGAAADTARAVADAVIVAYERMIVSFNYATAGQTYSLTVNMGAANSGFGASAGLTASFGGKPKAGTITMGAGSGTTPNGTGNGWYLDPTPYENSEFQGNVTNAFAGDASSTSPAFNKGDFYTVFAAELTHCMGLFGSSLSGWAARTVNSGVADTAEGGGIGTLWTFNGPSIQHLLTSNNGGPGGQNFGSAVHGAGPITTTIGGVVYNGAQDQGNAVYEFSRRYLINNTFSLMFKDAYGYLSIDPSKYGTFYSNLNSTTKSALVRGGATTSADKVSVTRTGNTIRVSVDVGTDIPGTGALPGPGDLPAFVTEYDISQLSSLNIQTGDGVDTITLAPDLGINVSVNGGVGNDTLIFQGGSGDDSVVYSGTTATFGTTAVSLISAIETVSINGGDGNDSLNLVGSAASETFNINANDFGGARVGFYSAVENLLVSTLDGSDIVNINSPSAKVMVDVGSTGATGDLINLIETAAGNPVSLIGSDVSLSSVSVNPDALGSASFSTDAATTLSNLSIAAGGTVDGAGDLLINNGLAFNGGSIAGSGKITVNGVTNAIGPDAKTLGRHLVAIGGLNVDGGSLTVAAGLSSSQAALVTSSLTVGSASSIDLTDNSAIIDYTGDSPLATIAAALGTGYAAGAWNGFGIRSSSAAATSGRAIGYAEATQLNSPSTFAGVPIDSTAVVLKYTVAGDATLDGTVDFGDLVKLAQNYNTSGKTWADGNFDFDTDGKVDFNDLVILAQHYNQTLASAAAVTAAPAVATSKNKATSGKATSAKASASVLA